MSAYIMNDEDTAIIAASLVEEITHGYMTGRLYKHRHDELVETVQSITGDRAERDRVDTVAFHLLRINTLSVNARYRENTPVRYKIEMPKTDPEVDQSKLYDLVGSWLYQSCEAEYCINSEVYRLLDDWRCQLAGEIVFRRNYHPEE